MGNPTVTGSASSLGDAELLSALAETERARRALYGTQLQLLAELENRPLPQGYPSVGSLLRETLRLNHSEARRRVQHAKTLITTHTVSGATVEPELPALAQALHAGEISPEHVEAIRATVARFPRPLHLTDLAHAEKILLDAAKQHEPAIVTRLGKRIIDHLDADGTPPTDDELAHPKRSLDLQPGHAGRIRGRFDLDAEAGQLLANLLSPLAAPAPTEEGEPVNLMITIPLEQLETELGYALLDGGAPISASQIRRIACDANLIPSTLGAQAELLDIGRKTRTVPLAIRRALIARDRGCAFPGCDRHAKWCHAHHVTFWGEGGGTKLDNLVLLCGRHHRIIHHTDWQVRINPHDKRPEFIPPPTHDPQRKPQRNTLHHPLE